MTESYDRIRRCLRAGDLTTLFIEELGWDHHSAILTLPVQAQTFTLHAVAEKRGLTVLQCVAPPGEAIPPYPVRGEIERQVAQHYFEHLIIFTTADQTEQVWQWVKREPGKPLARREHHYQRDQSGDALIQKLQAIAFTLEQEAGLTLTDVVAGTRVAFDVERVTKRFYDRFQKEHNAFLAFLKDIPATEMQHWYASVMLNRLMFIYFIQRKGFLDGDSNYLSTKLTQMQQQGDDRYYRDFLCPLFFAGFARRPAERSPEINALLGTVPYLNGGLFLRHQIEERHGEQIAIPDRAFERLFGFFDQYHWHLDDRPLRDDNEINPDVLGYIFEKYINQKQMGAYYTREDITGYISQNTVLPFLFDTARQQCRVAFASEQSIWRLLRDNPDRYIYPAVRHGSEHELPPEIAAGIDDVTQRAHWNKAAPPEYALPTEIWREVVARRQRYAEVRAKLAAGDIGAINDLVTYNLDIRQFAQDVIQQCEGPELLRAFYRAIEQVTVLDPTAGSGAFLFAALNILEPLYDACLERMQGFLDDYDRAPIPGPSPTGGEGNTAPIPGPSPTGGEGKLPSPQRGRGAGGEGTASGEGKLPSPQREGSTSGEGKLEVPPALREKMVAVARSLRREATGSEDMLWQALRGKQLDGRKFRRQQPVGAFVLDFYCSSERLAVEVDGAIHENQREADAERQAILESLGIRFVRVTAAEVEQDMPTVLAHIRAAFASAMDSPPSVGKGSTPLPGVGEGPGVRGRKYRDFRETLERVGQHPNRHYFIFKSIIVNNLFGVDIMEEAVEICKLRLFLKLVAQIERAEQIEPLPDIDFNIQAGNTLVGFATYEEVQQAITTRPSDGQIKMLSSEDESTMARIEAAAQDVDRLFQAFRQQQTALGGAVTPEDKHELRRRLDALNDELNHYLAAEYGVTAPIPGPSPTGGEGNTAPIPGSSPTGGEGKTAPIPGPSPTGGEGKLPSPRRGKGAGGEGATSGEGKTAPIPGPSPTGGEGKHPSPRRGRGAGGEGAYAQWLATHQPFHWFVEFYGIMQRGGFDVIIGNPPYIGYSKVRHHYTVRGYVTEPCGNLYALTVERALALLRQGGRCGMIVPIASVSTDSMQALQNLYQSFVQWHSHYAVRPGKLFVGVDMNLTISLFYKTNERKNSYGTGYRRWSSGTTGDRRHIFETLSYVSEPCFTNHVNPHPKSGSSIEKKVLCRMLDHGRKLRAYTTPVGVTLYYHSGGRYWRKALLSKLSSHYKPVTIQSAFAPTVLALLNSQLFYWYWISNSNCMDVVSREVLDLPVFALDTVDPRPFYKLQEELLIAYNTSSTTRVRRGKHIQVEEINFDVHNAKPIIDEIDRALAQHYGFTAEELDFIINYDIKYRMGRDGGAGE